MVVSRWLLEEVRGEERGRDGTELMTDERGGGRALCIPCVAFAL
jgi:hypothetical protein